MEVGCSKCPFWTSHLLVSSLALNPTRRRTGSVQTRRNGQSQSCRASDRFGPRKFLAFEQRRCLFPEWACALALIVSGSCAGGHVSFSKKHKQQLNEAVRVKWVRVTKASQVLLASFDRSRRPKVRKPPKRNSLRTFSLDSQSQISHYFGLFGPKVMSQVVASSQKQSSSAKGTIPSQGNQYFTVYRGMLRIK